MIEAILFDVGGVLVEPDHPFFADALEGHGVGYDPELFTEAHYAGIAGLDRVAANGGKESWLEYGRAYAAHLGLKPSRSFDELSLHLRTIVGAPYIWCRPLASNVEAFGWLAEKRPVGIVSNAGGQVENMLRYTGICQVGAGRGTNVRCVIDSHVVGIRKPDPAIFGPALAALGLDASPNVVYVGDTVFNDVNGARAAGLRPMHLDPYGFCPDHSHEHLASVGNLLDLL